MFVHRVAGPSRVSMPPALASSRSRVQRKANFDAFVMVQRHMSRQSGQAGDGPSSWKKGQPADPEAMKKYSQQMDRMGRRGQERKLIDDADFPTLDVELIESGKYPRQLYFPYMPRRLRDWPIAHQISLEGIVFAILGKLHKDSILSIPSLPKRAVLFLNDVRKTTRRRLALPPPTSASNNSFKTAPSTSPGATQEGETTQTTPQSAALVVRSSPKNSSLTTTPTLSVSIFSKSYWRTYFRVLIQQTNPDGWTRNIYEFLAYLNRRLNWPSSGLREAIVAYVRDADKYGKDAREYYMKKLQNDRMNFNAMLLIAEKRPSPELYFDRYGVAIRKFGASWFSKAQRDHRAWENKTFSNLSSPNSPLRGVLKTIKDEYINMNQTVANARFDKLRDFAAKKYLTELEKRAKVQSLNAKSASQTWTFERWVGEPECVSIRAKDFFSDYATTFNRGDHIVLNMLIKFDSVQTLTTTPKIGATEGGHRKQASKHVQTRRVTEYLIVDYRTWAWKGNLKFIQQVYPGQKLDVMSLEMTEEKLLEQMREKKKREQEEEDEESEEMGTAKGRPTAATS